MITTIYNKIKDKHLNYYTVFMRPSTALVMKLEQKIAQVFFKLFHRISKC